MVLVARALVPGRYLGTRLLYDYADCDANCDGAAAVTDSSMHVATLLGSKSKTGSKSL